jgi:hypothetical protein
MSSKALSAKDASTIRYFYNRYGYTQRELAALYDVDRKTIWRIVNHYTYKDAIRPCPAEDAIEKLELGMPADMPADDDFMYQGIEIDPPDIRWFGWVLLLTLFVCVGGVALILANAFGWI